MASINRMETNHRKEIVKKKLPFFWVSRQETLFRLVEDLFWDRRITDDGEKLSHIVEALGKEAASEELIRKPPETRKYVTIKAALTKNSYRNGRNMFIDFSKKLQPPRLFPPPHLVILHFLHPLHVYSNLQVYYRDESIE